MGTTISLIHETLCRYQDLQDKSLKKVKCLCSLGYYITCDLAFKNTVALYNYFNLLKNLYLFKESIKTSIKNEFKNVLVINGT